MTPPIPGLRNDARNRFVPVGTAPDSLGRMQIGDRRLLLSAEEGLEPAVQRAGRRPGGLGHDADRAGRVRGRRRDSAVDGERDLARQTEHVPVRC